jgi:hypothetical protein
MIPGATGSETGLASLNGTIPSNAVFDARHPFCGIDRIAHFLIAR